MRKIAVLLGTIGCICLFAILFWSNTPIDGTSVTAPQKANAGNIPELSHEQIVSTLGEFMEILVQETDEHGIVLRIDNLEDLYQAFDALAAREVVQPYVEYYYTETEEGLYLLPTETPPWFIPENEYDIKTSGNKVTITQQNTTDLYGTYTIEIEFTFDGSQWKITKITH